MSKEKNRTPISAIIGTTFAVSLLVGSAANATENPFSLSDPSASYTVAESHEEGSCGEGKCGDDKEAKGKKEDCCGDKKGEKKAEGSCGEGSCGDGAKKEEEGKCGEGRCGD